MSLNDFEVLSQIGEGHFSTVHKVKRLHDNHIYALKKVRLTDLQQKQIHNAVNEIRILASIRHPNIIGYKQAFYDLPSKCLCIIMEYADGGDLQRKIIDHRNKGLYLKEDYIWDVFGQILSGLAKMHDLGILHRDMKSSNIYLMRNGTVKIGDLNVSKVVRKEGMCETQTGAPYYSSPQVWRNEAYDSKSDVWSLGCILYELINLKLPFRARDMEGLYKKVNRGFYPRINKSYSDDLDSIIKSLLEIDPKQRVNCRQMLTWKTVSKNLKKSRDSDLIEKSVLLRTIKIAKNISYIGQKLPLPNYTPLKYKHNSLGQIQSKKKSDHQSLSLSYNKSLTPSHNKSNILTKSVILKKQKIRLPPVNSLNQSVGNSRKKVLIRNNSKLSNQRYDQKKSKISISEKVNPRYQRAKSHKIDSQDNINNYRNVFK